MPANEHQDDTVEKYLRRVFEHQFETLEWARTDEGMQRSAFEYKSRRFVDEQIDEHERRTGVKLTERELSEVATLVRVANRVDLTRDLRREAFSEVGSIICQSNGRDELLSSPSVSAVDRPGYRNCKVLPFYGGPLNNKALKLKDSCMWWIYREMHETGEVCYRYDRTKFQCSCGETLDVFIYQGIRRDERPPGLNGRVMWAADDQS